MFSSESWKHDINAKCLRILLVLIPSHVYIYSHAYFPKINLIPSSYSGNNVVILYGHHGNRVTYIATARAARRSLVWRI